MQIKELEPTKDNLIKALKEDFFSRNEDVLRFAQLCSLCEGNYSIAVNGRWGSGKTFFVKQVQLLIDSCNDLTRSLTPEEKTEIKNCFKNFCVKEEDDLEIDNEVVFYYDAWANDNDMDPMLSIVYQMAVSCGLEYHFDKYPSILKIASEIIDTVSGTNISKLTEILKKENALDLIQKQKDLQQTIQEFFKQLICEHGNRLIVIIDELDRCRPDFAVRLLERVKHYFADDQITFIFSINTAELQHTISNVYGEKFDSCRYLDRFFDLQISLPEPNMTRLYEALGLNASHVYEEVCKRVIEYCHFGIREIFRFERNTHIAFDKNQQYAFGFDDGKALEFGLHVLVPLLIGLKMSDASEYERFINGEDPSPLTTILELRDEPLYYCTLLLSQGEAFVGSNSNTNELKEVDYNQRIIEYYNAMFNNKKERHFDETHIGKLGISDDTRKQILRAASMISPYSNFNEV